MYVRLIYIYRSVHRLARVKTSQVDFDGKIALTYRYYALNFALEERTRQ